MSGSGLATNFSCNNYFNRVYFCATASYQFQRYYRTGGFDDCSEAFEDLSTCMKIKISKDEDAKKLVDELEAKSEPKRHVWAMHELPRKDFRFRNTEVWDEAPCADVEPKRRWPPEGMDAGAMPEVLSAAAPGEDDEPNASR